MENKANKYSLAEIALLGMFGIGLLLSYWFVTDRRTIQLSDPIAAPFAGLKVSLPAGRGWVNQKEWVFSDPQNAFVLMGMIKKSALEAATVTWAYHWHPAEERFDDIIKSMVGQDHFSSVRIIETKADKLNFTVMIIASPIRGSSEGVENYYYALCKMPLGGLLKLEVRTTIDEKLAKRIFETAIKGVSYTADWPPPTQDSMVMLKPDLQHCILD